MAKNDKRASKCTDSVIRKICLLIEKKARWKEIAEVLSIGERTLRLWREEKSEFYQPKLIAALEATYEKMSCDQTKSDQHRQSKYHTLRRVTKERQTIDIRTAVPKMELPKGAKRLPGKNELPPPMPPMSFTKKEISEYAETFLDLKLPFDRKITKGQMRIACQKRLRELTVTTMVKIRDDNQEAEPNQQAVKNVLQNCGPENERWSFEQKLDVGGEVALLPPKITKV